MFSMRAPCEQKDSQQRERGGVGDIAMTHRAREKEREGGRQREQAVSQVDGKTALVQPDTCNSICYLHLRGRRPAAILHLIYGDIFTTQEHFYNGLSYFGDLYVKK